MYLTCDNNVKYVLKTTGLSLDELESIVGRFRKDHYKWAGKLKGMFKEDWDGNMKIVHHFTQKTLWESK